MTFCRRLIPRLVITFFSAASLPAWAQDKADSAHTSARQAMSSVLADYLVTFDRRSAQNRLGEILIKDPTYRPALFNLALLFEADGDGPTAKEYYSHVLQPGGEDSLNANARSGIERVDAMKNGVVVDYSAIVGHATAFKHAGLSAFAVAGALDAVRVSPERWEAYAVAADGLEAMGDYARALGMLQSSLNRAPQAMRERLRIEIARMRADQSVQPLITSANGFFKQRKYGGAAVRFQEAWSLNPQNIQVGLAAAKSAILAGQSEKAREIIAGIRKHDNGGDVERELGRMLETLHQ
jgi:tetratricopeptide (TPR) repeat protein